MVRSNTRDFREPEAQSSVKEYLRGNPMKARIFMTALWASGAALLSAHAGQASIGDEAAAAQVRQALHQDPYFYDRHVQVLARDGAIVLQGFVMSAWDLTDAIRIARRAAGNHRIVDNLELEVGGRQ
jgi:hypothetical protein